MDNSSRYYEKSLFIPNKLQKKKKKLIQKLTDESSVKVKKVGEFVLKSILAICVQKKLHYILIILRQADN